MNIAKLLVKLHQVTLHSPKFFCTSAPHTARSGISLVENMVAVAIVAVIFSGLFVLSSHCMNITNSGRQAAQASLGIADRMSTLRNSTWAQLTNSSYLQNSVLNTPTSGSSKLNTVTETITINTYPTPLSPAISVIRSPSSSSVSTTNSSIANGNMARVDILLSWSGPGGRTRVQSTTTIIARINP